MLAGNVEAPVKPASFLLLSFLTLCTSANTQQVTPDPSSSIPTLRAQASLVVVDVVVTDANGNPIHSLTREDFAIRESGILQQPRVFEEHSTVPPVGPSTATRAEPLPPGTFTNRIVAPRASGLTVILLDRLNTPLKDQPYLHQQLVAYLRTLSPGTPVAIFSLNSRLKLLQGFTTDQRVLQTTAESTLQEKSVLLSNGQEANAVDPTIKQKLEDMHLTDSMPEDAKNRLVGYLQNGEDRIESAQSMTRSRLTLDGIDLLARSLASLPGRKNLIWLSGSFAVHLAPHFRREDVKNPYRDLFAVNGNVEQEFREAANLLARSQVAVYPIDSRGLIPSAPMSAAVPRVQFATDNFAMGEDEENFSATLAQEHSVMERLAYESGGHAFFNTTDLTGAIEKAADDGTNYYTLAYTPTNPKWNGNFRKIDIKLAHKGLHLSYRHGYWADDPNSSRSALTRAPQPGEDLHGRVDQNVLVRALGHGVPEPTQINYKLKVAPSSGSTETTLAPNNRIDGPDYAPSHPPYRRYNIDFLADTHDLAFLEQPDGTYSAMLEFVSVVFDAEGRLNTTITNFTKVTVNRSQHERILNEDLHFTQDLSIPQSGAHSIRTAVFDLSTSRIGAIEIPVALVSALPPVAPGPAPGPRAAALKVREKAAENPIH